MCGNETLQVVETAIGVDIDVSRGRWRLAGKEELHGWYWELVVVGQSAERQTYRRLDA